MANTVPFSGLVTLDCLIVLNNQNADNTGYIVYHNNSTGTGAATNSQLLGINKYGCGQYLMWEEKGMRIGLRSVTNSGCGDLHFTAGSDSPKMVIRCSGNIDIQSGGILNIYRADNTRALQLYTTNDETVIDSWAASSEPLMIRSNGSGGRIVLHTNGAERVRINCAGNVGIGSTSPNILGFTGRMLTVNGIGNYQGLELAVCGTARMTMVANIEGTLGYISTRQAGMSLIFEAGAAQERMRITCCGNVGIGCTTPSNTLEVNGTGRFRNTVDIGVSASSASRFQLNFQNWNTSNSYPYITFQNPAANCRHGIGINTSDNFVIGRATGVDCNFAHQDFVIVNSTGNVGINCLTPSYKLHVNGTFYAAGSSQDYKQSICNYNTDSCMFMKLKPVTYQYKDEYCHLGKELKSGTQIGLIAEDVAEVYPELAILVNEEDEKVVRNVDYEKLSIILLSELQKLRAEVDELKSK